MKRANEYRPPRPYCGWLIFIMSVSTIYYAEPTIRRSTDDLFFRLRPLLCSVCFAKNDSPNRFSLASPWSRVRDISTAGSVSLIDIKTKKAGNACFFCFGLSVHNGFDKTQEKQVATHIFDTQTAYFRSFKHKMEGFLL